MKYISNFFKLLFILFIYFLTSLIPLSCVLGMFVKLSEHSESNFTKGICALIIMVSIFLWFLYVIFKFIGIFYRNKWNIDNFYKDLKQQSKRRDPLNFKTFMFK